MDNAKLKTIETIAKIFSLVAIPVVVALVTILVNSRSTTQSIKQEYVRLAIELLKEPAATQDQDLRAWAVQLMKQNSPVQLPEQLARKLQKDQDLGASLPLLTEMTVPPRSSVGLFENRTAAETRIVLATKLKSVGTPLEVWTGARGQGRLLAAFAEEDDASVRTLHIHGTKFDVDAREQVFVLLPKEGVYLWNPHETTGVDLMVSVSYPRVK